MYAGGVVDLKIKTEIINYFIGAYNAINYSVKAKIVIESTGVQSTLLTDVENIDIINNIFTLDIENGNIDINLKIYEVDVLEDEDVLTLQFKNESNEIRISI